jgi:membrane protein
MAVPREASHERPRDLRPLGRRLADGATAMLLLARDAAVRWAGDACYRYGASLAYAALFSIFPLLLLCVTTFGYVLGDGDDVRRQVIASFSSVTSPAMRELLDETLQSLQTHRTARGIGALVGAVTLLLGASGVFSELQAALDAIWRVKAPPANGVWASVMQAIRSKAFSFAIVLLAAGVLFASLVLNAALSAAENVAVRFGGSLAWRWVEAVVSTGVLGLLLAAVYRAVPQTKVEWRDVALAALVTSLVFTVLKGALGWYLGHFATYAAYGAVGAVLGLLTWIYVAGMVFLWGAEFSRVYAERYGSLASAARPSAAG